MNCNVIFQYIFHEDLMSLMKYASVKRRRSYPLIPTTKNLIYLFKYDDTLISGIETESDII